MADFTRVPTSDPGVNVYYVRPAALRVPNFFAEYASNALRVKNSHAEAVWQHRLSLMTPRDRTEAIAKNFTEQQSIISAAHERRAEAAKAIREKGKADMEWVGKEVSARGQTQQALTGRGHMATKQRGQDMSLFADVQGIGSPGPGDLDVEDHMRPLRENILPRLQEKTLDPGYAQAQVADRARQMADQTSKKSDRIRAYRALEEFTDLVYGAGGQENEALKRQTMADVAVKLGIHAEDVLPAGELASAGASFPRERMPLAPEVDVAGQRYESEAAVNAALEELYAQPLLDDEERARVEDLKALRARYAEEHGTIQDIPASTFASLLGQPSRRARARQAPSARFADVLPPAAAPAAAAAPPPAPTPAPTDQPATAGEQATEFYEQEFGLARTDTDTDTATDTATDTDDTPVEPTPATQKRAARAIAEQIQDVTPTTKKDWRTPTKPDSGTAEGEKDWRTPTKPGSGEEEEEEGKTKKKDKK